MFCSTMMSPESTRSWTQLRSRRSAGEALGHGGRDVAREVVRLAAHDVADRARVNAIHQLDERGAVADLKADVERQLAFGSLADLDDALRAGDVDGDGLLAVDVFAP